MTDIGDSRISVFLKNVSEEDIDKLSGDLCDLFVKHGYNTGDWADAPAVLMHIEGWPWPANDGDAGKFIEELNFAGGALVIPNAGDDA